MGTSLSKNLAINELARHLCDFLPGNAHPYADQTISFKAIAYGKGLGNYWSTGSKLSSLIKFLQSTYDNARSKFCDVIIEIVKTAMVYRNNKGNPIQREDIEKINSILLDLEFKIPELYDQKFLRNLPSSKKESISVNKKNDINVDNEIFLQKRKSLKDELLSISNLKPVEKGFSLEKFVNRMFQLYGLEPRTSFRLKGEQIDGSFILNSETYLVEVKWCSSSIAVEDLFAFKGKVDNKATWTRGLFISMNGFTENGLVAFSKGTTNIIGMDGNDMFTILNGEMRLNDALERKTRHAAETGDFFISVFDLARLY